MLKGRFAPSPTGRMHLGNVFCALLSWLSAKSKGGEWLLRIEDIDPQRSRREYAQQLMDDLEWLGLEWDNTPVWQSERGDIYEHYLHLLHEMGLTYPCYCTRADIMATQAPHESDGRVVYKGTCRPQKLKNERIEELKNDAIKREERQSPLTSPSGSIIGVIGSAASLVEEANEELRMKNSLATRPKAEHLDNHYQLSIINYQLYSPSAATRLMVPDEVIPFCDGHYGRHDINLQEHCGDYILRRKDGAWAYQLAVVVDDALMGVTEIVRGRDLLLSSPQQIHLRQVLFPGAATRNAGKTVENDGADPAAASKATPEDAVSPLHFYHHPLLCNGQGQRLCKRDKSLDLGYLRECGTTPDTIIGHLAHLAGLIPEPAPLSPQDLLKDFDWAKVPTEDVTVPEALLNKIDAP